jgi:bifunctional non-homologous end joining protein LigD
MNPAYRPMLATLVDEPFDDKDWVFETKWDGFRLVTEKRGNSMRLWSRNGIDVTSRYATLLPALQKVEGSCVIDGEICALDAQGRSRLQLLQNALNKKAKLLYVAFDALFVDRKDIRQKPLLERKQTLKTLLPRDPLLRYSEHVAEFGERELAKAQRAHEEGVIAKRAAGLYYSGKRTREWLKFKAVHEQEVVIVGYTERRRSRKYLWLTGTCGTPQSTETPGLCWACRHRFRSGRAKIPLWDDAAAANRQEAFRSKSEGRERDNVAYSQARGRGKIHRVDE